MPSQTWVIIQKSFPKKEGGNESAKKTVVYGRASARDLVARVECSLCCSHGTGLQRDGCLV